MIKYFLIKRCRIVGATDRLNDILIANSKVIAIGQNLYRPSLTSEEIDAKGRLITPGLVDINFPHSLLMNTEELRRHVHEDVQAGFTTWIGKETPSQMSETMRRLDRQDPRTLNYSLHFSIDEFRHGDLSKIRDLAVPNGLPSLHYTLSSNKAAENDRLDLFLATAAKNDMLFVFDVKTQPNADDQIRMIRTICSKISSHEATSNAKTSFRALFTNIRFVEELRVIAQARTNEGYGHKLSAVINPSDEASGTIGLTTISQKALTDILRQHRWTTAAIVNNASSRSEQIKSMVEFGVNQGLTNDEMVEYFITRQCQFTGLYPNKGTIQVGCDADFCILDNSQIVTVIQNGLVTYNNEIIHNNISGKQAFRRFV